MKSPPISCIVPVFNGERYLREALDSMLAQTYRPLEIVVADDGSNDSRAAVVMEYGSQVRYLSQLNSGPAATLNLSLSAAQGEFVVFLDVDDLWHSEKLVVQMVRPHKRPEIDLCLHAPDGPLREREEHKAVLRDGYFSTKFTAKACLGGALLA